MDTIVFTASSLVDLLTQIDELSELPIDISESESNISLHIGDATYDLPVAYAQEVIVDDDVVDTIESIDEDVYDDLVDNDIINPDEAIEGGLIKELAKTLALGGMIRLSSKLLK